MIKTYSILFPCILLLACGSKNVTSQKEKNDWEIMNLKGRVKSVSQKSFITSLGHTQAAPGDNAEQIFDFDKVFNEAGYTTSETTYGMSEKLSTKSIGYDAENRIIKSITAMESGSLTSEITNKYDASGNRIESINKLTENDNGITSVTESITTYTYDPSNHLTETSEISTINSNGIKNERNRKSVSTYDNDGNLIKIMIYENDQLTGESTHTYEDGKLTEANFNAAGGIYTTSEKYDKHQRMISSDVKGSISLHKEFTYDENGDKTSSTITYDNKPSKSTYTYKYDDKGNWIEQYQSFDEAITYTIYRKIEYWP